MDDFETRLTGLLREGAATARPFDQLDAVVDPFDEPLVGRGGANGRGRALRPLLAAAAAVAVIVGLVAIIGRNTPESASGPDDGGGTARFSFVTPQVSLAADDFWIEVGGLRFSPVDVEVEVISDPGDAAYETLELVWHEQGHEMMVNIYFQSDGTTWSANELRTRNARLPEADWVTFTGDFFRSELGSPWTGTFDQTATEDGVTSHLHIENLRLYAFLGFGPGGVVVPTTNVVTPPDGGSLVVPPLAAGLPDTGRAWTPEGSLVLAMATEVLQHECMVAKGWDYRLPTAESWVAGIGGWQPHDLLGIVAPAGARATGYHDPNTKASYPLEVFANSLSEAERTRFYNELRPQGGPTADIVGPDGSVLSQRGAGGCFGEAAAALNPFFDGQEGLRESLEMALQQGAPEIAAADTKVTAALAAWSSCVETSVGETAATPNELARRYAFEGDAPTAHEIEVADADATCQAATDLWHVYHVALANAERALLGDRVGDYDELTRQRVELIALARQILTDRGIEIPSLD